jgi:hypothetical protein
MIMHWLQRTANHTIEPHPIARRRQAVLPYRAAAPNSSRSPPSSQRTPHPDPGCLATLQQLLANGCDRPLYDPDIHISELRANLHHTHTGPLTHT